MEDLLMQFIAKYKKKFGIDLSEGEPLRNLFLEFGKRPKQCRSLFNTKTVGNTLKGMRFIAWLYKNGKQK